MLKMSAGTVLQGMCRDTFLFLLLSTKEYTVYRCANSHFLLNYLITQTGTQAVVTAVCC